VSEAAKPQEEEGAPKKAKPPILSIAIAATLCAASGAGVYFLAPASAFSPKAEGQASAASLDEKKHESSAKNESHGAKADAGEAASAAHFEIVGARGVYTPEAIVVSIRPSGRVRYLKLSIAVETSVDSEAAFVENDMRIRDALNTYLRAVEVSALEDPASLGRIRAQLARRIEFVVAPAPVDAVLITDFILS
jgi:flagellar basal body-associated protein FliL